MALRARGIVVTVVDHPGACWSMPAPGLLLVDAESLSLDEVERLRELFDELQRRGIRVMLATAGLDRLDWEYVESRSREVKRDEEPSGE
jgi:sugar phosphate isomerase/epimerase